MSSPIKITFYNPDDSIKAEYSKLHIPFGMVDAALDLAGNLEKKNDQESWEVVKAFIVEVFGNQFSLDELNRGADLEDITRVFNDIVAKIDWIAKSFNPNPTRPGSRPAIYKRQRKQR